MPTVNDARLALVEEGPGTPRYQSALRLLPLAAIVLVSIWHLASIRHYETERFTQSGWDKVRAHLTKNFQTGDLVLCRPDFTDPLCRMHLGKFMTLASLARMDSETYSRIWTVDLYGASGGPNGRAYQETSVNISGARVTLWKQEPRVVLYDFVDKAEKKRSSQVLIAEVGFSPRRCVHARTVKRQKTWLKFKDVPAGHLVGYIGIADVFTRRDIREPAVIELWSSDSLIAAQTAGVDQGWVRFSAALREPIAEVRVALSSQAPVREICFAAQVREIEQP